MTPFKIKIRHKTSNRVWEQIIDRDVLAYEPIWRYVQKLIGYKIYELVQDEVVYYITDQIDIEL